MNPFISKKIVDRINEVAGLSVRLTNKGEPIYSFIQLHKRHNKLIVSQQIDNKHTLKEIKPLLSTRCPVLINIDGWGVLVKKSNNRASTGQESNYLGDDKEFISNYFQLNEKDQTYVSVIRLDLFQQTINPIIETGIDIFGIDIGPFEAVRLLALLNKSGEFNVGTRLIKLNSGTVEDIIGGQTSTNNLITIGDEKIQIELVATYALIANFFISGNLPSLQGNNSYLNNFLYKKLGHYTGWGALLILLLGLLINFFLFNHYNKQSNELNIEFKTQQVLYDKLEIVKNELLQKEELIEQGNLENKSVYAYFADRLAMTMPGTLTLQQMTFQPLERKITNDREAIFDPNKLLVSGETPGNVLLRHWIDNIKREKWVKQIELVFYEQKKNNLPALFKLEIVITDGKIVK